MKKITLIKVLFVLICSEAVANNYNFKVLEGLGESQRLIEIAYRAGGKDKSLYHFEKARAYRDISVLFASEMEEVGSKIFAIKSMNSASKSMEGSNTPDKLESIVLSKKEQKEQEKDENTVSKQTINPDQLFSDVQRLRDDKAFACAPKELAYTEAYYEAIGYELSKERPKPSLLKTFYNSYLSNYLIAKEKVEISKKESLECYVGKIELPSGPESKEVKEEPVAKASESLAEEKAEKVERTEEPLMVRARVHFDFGKAQIKKEYIPLLNEVVKVLKENPKVSIRIEGYTDDIGSKAYNERLALRRAMAIKDYLVKQGIEAERIEIVGFGKEKYIAENKTEIGRLTNRRAEFIVIQVPSQ